jgi:hypothetical protein
MGDKLVQEPDFVVTIPAYFLVRVPEVQDPAEVVRNTLRLGSKGQGKRRQWFVPVFTSEDLAGQFAAEVRKVDDKLRVIGIYTLKDWVTLLDALYANGDSYTAFDPQHTHVEHIAISDLVAAARKALVDDPQPDSSGRLRDHGPGRSWLRSRLAALLAGPAPASDGRARAGDTGREGTAVPSVDTEHANSHLTPRPGRIART